MDMGFLIGENFMNRILALLPQVSLNPNPVKPSKINLKQQDMSIKNRSLKNGLISI